MNKKDLDGRLSEEAAMKILEDCINGDEDDDGVVTSVPKAHAPPPPAEIMTPEQESVADNPFTTESNSPNPPLVDEPLFDPLMIAAAPPENPPVDETQPMEKYPENETPKKDNDRPAPPPPKSPARWIVGVIVVVCCVVLTVAFAKGCSENTKGSSNHVPPPAPATPTSTTPIPLPPPTVGTRTVFDASECSDAQITLRSDGAYVFTDCVSIH